MATDEAELEIALRDDQAVHEWRRDEALAAGLTLDEAVAFAEDREQELRVLRNLVKGGATPAQIRGVLFGASAAAPLSLFDRAPVAG